MGNIHELFGGTRLFFGRKETPTREKILELYPGLQILKDQGLLPKSMAIILDGNGRWAKEHNVSVTEGHSAGAMAAKKTMQACVDLEIDLSLWILSPDNIKKRSPEEVAGIYKVFKDNINDLVKTARAENGKIIHIGDLHDLPGDVRLALRKAEWKTRKNTGSKLGLAINYDQMAQTVHIANRAREGRKKDPYTRGDVIKLMYGKGEIQEAEAVVRTGKQTRLSGFGLPFVGSSSELFFPPVHLPDFNLKHIHDVLIDFSQRNRTLGGRNGK